VAEFVSILIMHGIGDWFLVFGAVLCEDLEIVLGLNHFDFCFVCFSVFCLLYCWINQ
jgi:hypothetical protein